MPKFNDHQVKEINAIISKIEKAIESKKPADISIGARDRIIVRTLLGANDIQQVTVSFFECKREYSGEVLRQVMDRKGLKQHKFSANLQKDIYLIVSQ